MLTERSPAGRRYARRVTVAMTIYAGVLAGAIYVFQESPPAGALKYLLAVAPAAPLVAVVAIVAVYLAEETDEFRRVRAVQALLIALGFTLAATTVWGFLQAFAGLPQIPLYWTFPVFSVGMAIAQPLVWWRYR